MKDGEATIKAETARLGKTTRESEGVATEVVPAPAPPTDSAIAAGKFARVRYMGGITVNMGNFESSRAEVSVEFPSKLSPEALDSTYDFAKAWVGDRLLKEIEELQAERDGAPEGTGAVSGAPAPAKKGR